MACADGFVAVYWPAEMIRTSFEKNPAHFPQNNELSRFEIQPKNAQDTRC